MQFIRMIGLILTVLVLNVRAQDPAGFLSTDKNLSGDESAFYAETKQVNQFFRRFNAEEDVRGVRFSSDDAGYRDPELRRRYLGMLFDQNNRNMPELLKEAFISDVTKSNAPAYLDFHGENWYSEVNAWFMRGRERVNVILFMTLVKENLGSKWVINDVYFPPYENLYKRDENSLTRFLHPLSHELDFMNLDRVFGSEEYIGDYFNQEYEVDKLSIFLFELRTNQLKFQQVTEVKFHFFQLDGWYVEISEFNRPGFNTGWLISNLIRLEPGQKERLMNFIYRRDE
jgi:hypothetical protein